MSEPFIGEIRIFAGNFAPRGWALCDGQLLAVSQNDALFSLFGTIYGGDGRTTFGLPDLRGRLPVHMGTGPGLSQRRLGSKGGAEDVNLTTNQLPPHAHPMANGSAGTSADPAGKYPASSPDILQFKGGGGSGTLSPVAGSGAAGGGQSHTNLTPFLCVHFIVALVGIYPSRS